MLQLNNETTDAVATINPVQDFNPEQLAAIETSSRQALVKLNCSRRLIIIS